MNPTRVVLGKLAAQAGKLLRISVYFTVVAGVLALVAARFAWAQAKKTALETGSELVRLTAAGNLSGVYRLDMNGEKVNVASASSDAPVDVLLDRFQKACETHADGLAVDFANLRPAIATNGALHQTGHPGAGVLRNGDEKQGVVACFAMGGAVGEVEAYKRVAAFAETGDLGKIGQVRYLTARKDAGSTHVVALWTEGSLDVKKMFPETGDAPGSDPKDVPRPPNGRRLFTAFAQGAPYAIRVYEAGASADAVLAQYDALMPKLGWVPNADVPKESAASKLLTRAYARGGIDLLVSVGADPKCTTVSIVEMGAPNPTAAK